MWKRLGGASLMICGLIAPVMAVSFVPNDYYPNFSLQDEWEEMLGLLEDIEAAVRVGDDLDEDLFQDLNAVFDDLFDFFPATPSNNVIYKQCLLITEDLGQNFVQNDYLIFKDRCFDPIGQIIRDIQTKFTVKAAIQANPKNGNAPLNVTLDARTSIDPSDDTIPADNYFWYYKDIEGDDRPIGKGPVINWTFDEEGNYIVHLTVRSANSVSEGIFDGEENVSINVAPKAALLVVYLNGKKLTTDEPVRIGIQEAQAGVLVDATSTSPLGARTIVSHVWTIVGDDRYTVTRSGNGSPTQFVHEFPRNGVYTVTLEITDNENNRVRESYEVAVSDPVAVIKYSPTKGTTSSMWRFDGTASYSLSSRVSKYQWTVTDPDGNLIDQIDARQLERAFGLPGLYTIKLTVFDEFGKSSFDTKKIQVESTPPLPSFIVTPFSELKYPSQFILDASATFDEDERAGVDTLTYTWEFSNSEHVVIEREFDEGEQIIVSFNEPGIYEVKLTVDDQYGQRAIVEKEIDVESTLRPEMLVQPLATTRGNELTFEGTANKSIAFYAWEFGDGNEQNVEDSRVTHTYEKAGIYPVTLKVVTPSGEENEVYRQVFMGQQDMPIIVYEVKQSNNLHIQPTKSCVNRDNVSVPAYHVHRYQRFFIDSSKSLNVNGQVADLNTLFHPQNDDVYEQTTLNYEFSEQGCQYIDLFVDDTSTNKTDSVRIWFWVDNALPELTNVVLSFPQFGDDGGPGVGVGLQQPQAQGDEILSMERFDPLVVKATVQGARDLDGFISHFVWYYYKSEDPTKLIEIKVTPASVTYATFSLPRVPGEYTFGVKVVDNDDGEIRSEDVLGNGPEIFFPPSTKNPDIPLVTLQSNVGFAKAGDEVVLEAQASILSNRPDFAATRYFKFDYDGDGLYDLTTKKNRVTTTYENPGKYRPKVQVIYRGRGSVAWADWIEVQKGLNARYISTVYDNLVLWRDVSVGEIETSTLCLDIRNCADGGEFLFEGDEYGIVEYENYGPVDTKLTALDTFGNEAVYREQIQLVQEGRDGLTVVSLPAATPLGSGVEISVGNTLDNTVLLYLDLPDDANCYMDMDLTSDADGDGDPLFDEDVRCNELAIKRFGVDRDEIVGRIYYVDDGEIRTMEVTFSLLDVEFAIDEAYQAEYEEITDLLADFAGRELTVQEQYYQGLLLNLRSSLGEVDAVNSIVLQISDLLEIEGDIVSTAHRERIQILMIELADQSLQPALGASTYEIAKQSILLWLSDTAEQVALAEFENFEAKNGDQTAMKASLDSILQIADAERQVGNLDEVDFNDIKNRLCEIVTYYELPSQSCGTLPEIDPALLDIGGDDGGESGSSSVAKKIVRIVLVVVLIAALIFVGLIVLFAIKARRQKEDDEQGDT